MRPSLSALSHSRLSKFQTKSPLDQTNTFLFIQRFSNWQKILKFSLAEEELYDLLYEDPEEETVSTGITPRFNKDDPLKGISQLCASIAKWVDGKCSFSKIRQEELLLKNSILTTDEIPEEIPERVSEIYFSRNRLQEFSQKKVWSFNFDSAI